MLSLRSQRSQPVALSAEVNLQETGAAASLQVGQNHTEWKTHPLERATTGLGIVFDREVYEPGHPVQLSFHWPFADTSALAVWSGYGGTGHEVLAIQKGTVSLELEVKECLTGVDTECLITLAIVQPGEQGNANLTTLSRKLFDYYAPRTMIWTHRIEIGHVPKLKLGSVSVSPDVIPGSTVTVEVDVSVIDEPAVLLLNLL